MGASICNYKPHAMVRDAVLVLGLHKGKLVEMTELFMEMKPTITIFHMNGTYNSCSTLHVINIAFILLKGPMNVQCWNGNFLSTSQVVTQPPDGHHEAVTS